MEIGDGENSEKKEENSLQNLLNINKLRKDCEERGHRFSQGLPPYSPFMCFHCYLFTYDTTGLKYKI